jgi:hypothetical protein
VYKYHMRIEEITEPAPEKNTANAMLVRTILNYISKGNWPGAVAAGAITAAPQLKPYLTGDQWRVLNYAVNTYGAANFWNGLSAFASRVGVPFLSLAGWSGKLNTGEEDELNKRRYPPEQASVRKVDNQTPTQAA